MKGIVFTEFLDLVEDKFGIETVEQIIEESNLESKGAYTAVGTYKFTEMSALLTNLSNLTKVSVNDLLKIYGLHFFDVLASNYGSILKMYKTPLHLLESIDSHIHVEVRKLYPEAELPYFEVEKNTDSSLVMTYNSSRAMFAFAHGLIEKTFMFYGEKAIVKHKLLKEDGTLVRFEIKKI